MEKIWLEQYKKFGIPEELTPTTKTIVDLFQSAVKKFPEKRAVTTMGVTMSFSEVEDRVLHLAASLKKLGIQHGDRVAVMLPNCNQYPLSVFAVLALGATVVNVNPLYTTEEIKFILENSTPKAIIVLDMMADRLNGIVDASTLENVIVSSIADTFPGLKRGIINFILKYIKKEIKPLNYKHIKLHDLIYNIDIINSTDKYVIDAHSIKAEDLAFIQYTGATTGRPKGAMLSHSNIVANIRQIHVLLDAQVPDLSAQILICVLPLYHIFSLTANLFTFFFSGSENVMVPNPRDFKGFLKVLKTTPFTVMNALDTLYSKLLDNAEFMACEFPDFKYSVCGGMATRASVARRWYEKTGVVPANCYGLSETSPAVTMSPFSNEYTGSIGIPIPGTTVDIRNSETGLSVAQGETGAIMVKGDQVMHGYWNNEEQTKKTFTADGFLITGDVGYMDKDGFVFLSARESELIIVSGFNVYPAEVERVIDELGDVIDVAVVGSDCDKTGEQVNAFVVLKAGSNLTEDAIKAHCKKELTGYKLPRKYFFLSELPKTQVGKMDKKLLKANYLTK